MTDREVHFDPSADERSHGALGGVRVDASQPLRCGPPHADSQPSFSQVHISWAGDVDLTAGTPWAGTSGDGVVQVVPGLPEGHEDLDAADALELLAQAPSRV